jgi:hypothetical protein
MYKTIRSLTLLILFTVVVIGCQSRPITNIPVQQNTKGFTVAQTETLIETLPVDQQTRETKTPMGAPTSTITPTRITTVSRSVSPTPTISPPDLPTLTSQEAEKAIKEYMQTNGGCKACFWGIVPGVTTLGETRNFITTLNSLSQYSGIEQNHYDVVFGLKGGLFSVEPVFHYNNSLIIDGISMVLGLDNPGVNKADWSFYSPDNILRTYGIPSKVTIDIGEGPTPPGGKKKTDYILVLNFDQSNMVIEYSYAEDAVVSSTEYTVCPTKDRITSLKVWYGDYKDYPPDGGTEINQLSNLSNESFYQKMTPISGGECIKLKAAQ